MLTAEQRQEIISTYRVHPTDSGSPQVQIALLTHRINYLNEHLKQNRKDHHTQRGLLAMVGQRNRLLKYISRKDHEGYKALIKSLGLRK
ncbi:MAG: 30S ribosomal protein S15 [Planctomycetes bacterium]|nr:30S ribosomal protein S15 [Planctomycetota bacterium]